jgi:hypothetical protein
MGVDQSLATDVAAPGSRADSEIDQFIARRHGQRERGATDQFGQVLVEDRPDYDEEWARLRLEHERQQRSTRLEQWREHHLSQVRSLSRTLGSLIRHHLRELHRLDKGA